MRYWPSPEDFMEPRLQERGPEENLPKPEISQEIAEIEVEKAPPMRIRITVKNGNPLWELN
ncbi:MAG: hypothetical protein WCJ29_03965 [bacterium]